FASFDPATSSWRTSQRCLLEGWASYSETWPRAGMMRSGIAFRRQPLAPITSVIEFSSLPTPTATPYGSNKSPTSGAAVRPSLHSMARTGLWSTPKASDSTRGFSRSELRRKSPSLAALAHIPTPTVNDSRSGRNATAKRRPGARLSPGMTLVDYVTLYPNSDQPSRGTERWEVSGQLNPTWVEWLMGFPLGWTASDVSETQSYPKSRNSSGEES